MHDHNYTSGLKKTTLRENSMRKIEIIEKAQSTYDHLTKAIRFRIGPPKKEETKEAYQARFSNYIHEQTASVQTTLRSTLSTLVQDQENLSILLTQAHQGDAIYRELFNLTVILDEKLERLNNHTVRARVLSPTVARNDAPTDIITGYRFFFMHGSTKIILNAEPREAGQPTRVSLPENKQHLAKILDGLQPKIEREMILATHQTDKNKALLFSERCDNIDVKTARNNRLAERSEAASANAPCAIDMR